MASGVNFIKEIPSNEISENLKFVLKNVRGGQMALHNTCKTRAWMGLAPYVQDLPFFAGNPLKNHAKQKV